MKSNYDFSNAVKNPYAKKLKKTICINISESVLAYFKKLSEKTNIPYQTLINMFLEQAKAEKMEPKFVSKPPRKNKLHKKRDSIPPIFKSSRYYAVRNTRHNWGDFLGYGL